MLPVEKTPRGPRWQSRRCHSRVQNGHHHACGKGLRVSHGHTRSQTKCSWPRMQRRRLLLLPLLQPRGLACQLHMPCSRLNSVLRSVVPIRRQHLVTKDICTIRNSHQALA